MQDLEPDDSFFFFFYIITMHEKAYCEDGSERSGNKGFMEMQKNLQGNVQGTLEHESKLKIIYFMSGSKVWSTWRSGGTCLQRACMQARQ